MRSPFVSLGVETDRLAGLEHLEVLADRKRTLELPVDRLDGHQAHHAVVDDDKRHRLAIEGRRDQKARSQRVEVLVVLAADGIAREVITLDHPEAHPLVGLEALPFDVLGKRFEFSHCSLLRKWGQLGKV